MYETNKNLLYLLTIADCIDKIYVYSNNIHSAEDLLWINDQMNFNACTNPLIAIGEDSKKIDTKLKNYFPDYPWSEIAGMRNILAHDYRGKDPEIVFSVIKDYLDDLKNTVISLIKIIDPYKTQLKEYLQYPHYSHVKYLETI
jgi:uncharacterized protein with HEPN domain